jgi:hypothetical protein
MGRNQPRKDHCFKGAHMIAYENHRLISLNDILHPSDMKPAANFFYKSEYFKGGIGPFFRPVTIVHGLFSGSEYNHSVLQQKVKPVIP